MNFVQKPAYKGYKAYEYLEEGKDYPKIEWAQWDWAGRHVVELEPDQEAMVQEILKKHPYISLHDHPTFYPKDMSSIDHVGFGVDCMYGDHVGLHHAFAAALSTGDTSKTTVPYQEVPFVKYLENPTEASWNIPRWLIKHGYTDEEIIKVLGGNAIRVLREVWS